MFQINPGKPHNLIWSNGLDTRQKQQKRHKTRKVIILFYSNVYFRNFNNIKTCYFLQGLTPICSNTDHHGKQCRCPGQHLHGDGNPLDTLGFLMNGTECQRECWFLLQT